MYRDDSEDDQSITNESKINTPETINQILVEPSLAVSKDEIGPLEWSVKNNKTDLFKQLLADSRFNAEHKIVAFLNTLPFKKKPSIELVSALIESLYSKEPRFQQYIFEELLLKQAIIDKSLSLITFLLNEPKYTSFIEKIPEDTIGRLYWFSVEADYSPPYRRNEISALLNTHFRFKSKEILISDYMYGREPQYIKPYLELYINTEEEYLALIKQLNKKGLLGYSDKKKSCAAAFILADMENKTILDIDNGSVVRNLDKGIIEIFRNMEFEYKIASFNTANRIGSVALIIEIATALKQEIIKINNKELEKSIKPLKHYSMGIDFLREQNEKEINRHYLEIILLQLYSTEYRHFNPKIQAEKSEKLLRSLDIFKNLNFLYDIQNMDQIENLKAAISAFPRMSILKFIEESAEAGNQPLSLLLNEIIRSKEIESLMMAKDESISDPEIAKIEEQYFHEMSELEEVKSPKIVSFSYKNIAKGLVNKDPSDTPVSGETIENLTEEVKSSLQL